MIAATSCTSPALMRRRRAAGRLLAVCVAAPLLLTCSNGYDPFIDLSNARAHVVSRTFKTAAEGAVPIFSTESLSVVVALREDVDSFRVITPYSRLGDTVTVRLLPGTSSAPVGRIVFSLYDTGLIPITITTFRANGESFTEELPLRAVSPLHQDPVTGFINNRVALATDSVKDPDVLYHWAFTASAVVSSPSPRLDTLLPVFGGGGQGWLWVTDLRGSYASPKVAFTYALGDTQPPVIECVNKRPPGRLSDTLRTGDSTFVFAVMITDPGSGVVAAATLNGAPFGQQTGNVYTTQFKSLPTVTQFGPISLLVTATDKAGNTAQKRFWLTYDAAIGPSSNMVLRIISPAADSSTTGSAVRPVLGTVEDYSRDTLRAVILATVNGTALPPDTVAGNYRALWEFDAHLDRPVNRITVSAVDPASGLRVDTSLTIFHDAAARDTLPPVLADVAVNGKPVQSVCSVDADSAHLRIIAFDDGSGIDSLTVNGLLVAPVAGGYEYNAVVPLSHTMAGNAVLIRAVDEMQHEARMSLTVIRNALPALVQGLSSTPLQVGVAYRDTLVVYDKDHDPVNIAVASGPTGFGIGGAVVSWTPAVADAGQHVVVFSLNDGYQTVSAACTVLVAPQHNSPCSLTVASAHGLLRSDSLTLFDAAHPDTLHCTITDADSVVGDRYTVRITYGGILVVKQIGADRSFDVAVDPAALGGGAVSLGVSIEDQGGATAAVNLIVTLQKPAKPTCRLVLNTTATGANVMSSIVKFPLLVRLDGTVIDFRATPRGGVSFAKQNGTVLPMEVERWDSIGLVAEIWVLVDTVYGNCDTQSIVMQSPASGTSSGPGVFATGNGYVGVWHLGASNALGGFPDATANGYDGTSPSRYGSSATPTQTTGVIGWARSFDGINDWVDLGDRPGYHVWQYTVSFWAQSTTSSNDNTLRMVFCKANQLMAFDWSQYEVDLQRSHLLLLDNGYASARIPSVLNANTWYYICATYTGSSIAVYCNGVRGQSASAPGVTVGPGNLAIGIDPTPTGGLGGYGGYTGPYNAQAFGGLVDEFRFDNVARSDDWIKLCYETQKPGSKVVTFTGCTGGGTVTPPTGADFKVGDTLPPLATDGHNVGLLFGMTITLRKTATIQSLSIDVINAVGNVRMGLYNNTGTPGADGRPVTLMAQTNEFAPVAGWNTQAVTSPVSLPAGTYWICMEQSDNALTFGAGSSAVNTWIRWGPQAYGPLPVTAPSMPNNNDGLWSFYATFR